MQCVLIPPYGLVEFSHKEIAKLREGNRGGIWRIPPQIGGSQRSPLPRFSVLTTKEKHQLYEYMKNFGHILMPVLVPGAHICIAGHPMLQYLVQSAMVDAGFEVRSTLIRLYTSFRGGDRPKGAEKEFPEVCVTLRSAAEPWMLFRKPLSEKTVAANLRRRGTGGLRRLSAEKPIPEVIPSARTPVEEEQIAAHPCLKSQHFLRIIVRTLLPLGEGIVLDPFMGSGSTIAAAMAINYNAVGVELDPQYYNMAMVAIPTLTTLSPLMKGDKLARESDEIIKKTIIPEKFRQDSLF
jgi:hypothetical protein